MSGSEQIQSFLASMSARNRSASTIDIYTFALRALGRFAFARDKTILTANVTDIEAWILAMRKGKLSDGTIYGKLCAARSFYKWAEECDLVVKSPMLKIHFKAHPNLPRSPDIETARRLVAACDAGTWIGSRDRAILLAMYGSGCRVSELCGVLMSDYNGKEIRVMGKGRKERICLLPEQAIAAINHWIVHHRSERALNCEHLFTGQNNEPLTSNGVRNVLERRRKSLGVDTHTQYASGYKRSTMSPHAFRHLFATELLEQGASIRAIQELLGHSDIQTTQRYAHVTASLKKRTHDLLPAL